MTRCDKCGKVLKERQAYCFNVRSEWEAEIAESHRGYLCRDCFVDLYRWLWVKK